jgi:pimeloyl-ACP methyl ester carboxylesterase
MIGQLIDTIRYSLKKLPTNWQTNIHFIDTDYGKLRVLDTQGNKPIIINVPDGPNVMEHHEQLIEALSKHFRVICFEFPGFGYSYPSQKYDYTLEKSAKLILNLMDILKIERASLSFSCSNGFYAMKAAELAPDRFIHLFLAQTASFHSMKSWVETNIPKVLTYPIIGQLANISIEKKFAKVGYKYLLPKGTDLTSYENKALHSLNHGGCYCIASLVQGLTAELDNTLKLLDIPTTLIWGTKDYTHRKTNKSAILAHLPLCEIIEFDNCGHYPELENTNHFVKLVNERLQNKI